MTSILKSLITETTCFSIIQDQTRHLTKRSLVIFDIDDVLIMAKDHVLRGAHKNDFLDHYFNSLTPEESLCVSSHVWTVYETEITDTNVAYFNEDLKARGVSSIALTMGWNGAMAGRPSHCDDRIQILRDVGIDFTHSFPTMQETFFDDFQNCGKVPSFKEGVIFSCMLPKPGVLDAFLSAAEFIPDEVIFIDDLMRNLTEMRDYCLEKKIPYHGFHYLGVDAKNDTPLNEDVAHLQFQTAVKDKIWLSDDEAKVKLLAHKIK